MSIQAREYRVHAIAEIPGDADSVIMRLRLPRAESERIAPPGAQVSARGSLSMLQEGVDFTIPAASAPPVGSTVRITLTAIGR